MQSFPPLNTRVDKFPVVHRSNSDNLPKSERWHSVYFGSELGRSNVMTIVMSGLDGLTSNIAVLNKIFGPNLQNFRNGLKFFVKDGKSSFMEYNLFEILCLHNGAVIGGNAAAQSKKYLDNLSSMFKSKTQVSMEHRNLKSVVKLRNTIGLSLFTWRCPQDNCPARFVAEIDLNSHLTGYHAPERVRCFNQCRETFSKPFNMWRHIVDKHCLKGHFKMTTIPSVLHGEQGAMLRTQRQWTTRLPRPRPGPASLQLPNDRVKGHQGKNGWVSIYRMPGIEPP
ncbi:hypothetical protein BJY01DRAFT_119371 [Aspergillus pseudoustus]|uniref:C2H2-type domain-containing protein n=1 Tax=Aspergillus pseudoustus TaxID=1810923 RepID=A0ABR4IU47_9EURO